ncbi:M20/M25/M40 family metallo-hydrolase [Limibacter armeniacum]|uniref:M28 family metallopeptidase n=1 Tax=Limibacter armeniacum TaxID=466084 RepID=UPI002FE603A9
MSYKKISIFLLNSLTTTFLCALNPVFAQDAISDAESERIVSILANDDMEGRETGTKGNEKAARFIEEEFKKAGLSYMEGMNSYQQSFTLYTTTTQSQSIKLNKQKFSSNNSFALTDRTYFKTKKVSELNVVEINSGDDFRQKFSEYRAAEKPTLVLVDTAHSETFQQFSYYFRNTPPKNQLDDKHFSLWVLTADKKVKKAKIEIEKSVKEVKVTNIVGVLPGKKSDEKVLFSAHYDHIGIQEPIQGDSIANGADDDATGVAAVIQLANHFKKQKNERTLVFVAFDAEEQGLKGSEYFAQQVTPETFVAHVNIEMIGKPSDRGVRKAYVTGFEKSNLGAILKKEAGLHGYTFFKDPYTSYNLFMRSDNASMAKLGVPAHTVSSDPIDFDSYYHTVNDEIETLNFKNMTDVIRAISIGVTPIINGEATPSRIDYESRK